MTRWTPKDPVVVAGYTLTVEETWLREFTQEWFRLADGAADLESIADWAIELLATRANQNPIDVAREAWAAST